MPKFRFRLATLLKLRENTRDERRSALAEAYRVDELLQRRHDEAQQELAVVQRGYRAAIAPGPVDVDRLLSAQRYELTVKAQIHQFVQQRQQVAQEIERRREALVQADREVRVLEKLREQQFQRAVQGEEWQLVRLLDEVAQRCGVQEDDP